MSRPTSEEKVQLIQINPELWCGVNLVKKVI